MRAVDLLFVSGSLQQVSANRALLDVAEDHAEGLAQVHRFEGIAALPHFNPDLPDAIGSVLEWRDAVRRADGVVIASPEYAHSLPGSLKNALDWLVGSGELYGKPVALMSAGTSGGQRALDALAQTLHAQGALVVGQLSVAGVRPKLDPDTHRFADPETIEQTGALVVELVRVARTQQSGPIAAG